MLQEVNKKDGEYPEAVGKFLVSFNKKMKCCNNCDSRSLTRASLWRFVYTFTNISERNMQPRWQLVQHAPLLQVRGLRHSGTDRPGLLQAAQRLHHLRQRGSVHLRPRPLAGWSGDPYLHQGGQVVARHALLRL